MLKPNLLFITVDQMRFDCISKLNHPVVETPNLDALIEKGVMFTNAYSATPTCIPARAAIMTGMSQKGHGRIGYEEGIPWNYKHTLAGELAEAGYHTQCVGKMHVNPARNLCGFHNVVLHDGYLHHNRNKIGTPFAEHFDQVDDYLPWLRQNTGATLDISDLGLDCNASTVARPWHLPEYLHPTNWAVTQSIDFLRRRDPGKPFFLWTSFVRPHSPLDPPQVYWDRYIDAEFPECPVGDWVNTEAAASAGIGPTITKGIIPKRRLNRAQAAYYALITHLDDQIGRLLDSLQEYGMSNNTFIIFTSDHGELIGDHHFFRKSLPYEGSAKIPLILCDLSGSLGLIKGSRVEQVVELRDIMPTFLEAADAPKPSTVEGKSILPLCRNNDADETWRTYLHGEHAYGELSHHYVTDGKWKYIWFSQTGEEQLFHLVKDPSELRNLASDDRCSVERRDWREKLIIELTDREEGFVAEGRLITGITPRTCLSHIL